MDYNPFRTDDLWPQSLHAADMKEGSLFDELQVPLAIPSNSAFQAQKPPPDSFHIPELDNFSFLSLDDLSLPSPQGKSQDGAQEVIEGFDMWSVEQARELVRPRLRTWEAFTEPERNISEHTAYIAEAGPGIWDALLAEGVKGAETVLQPDVVLGCLALLGQGRPSKLFQLDRKGTQLEPILESFRPSGVSVTCSQSVVEAFNQTGRKFNALRRFVQDAYTARSALPSRIALAGCIRTLLDSVDQHLISALPSARTLLQLQAIFHSLHDLLVGLLELSTACQYRTSEEDVLLGLQRAVYSLVNSRHPYVATYEAVLSRVTQPFLSSLFARMGLQTSDGDGVELTVPFSDGYPHVSDRSLDDSGNPSMKHSQLLEDDELAVFHEISAGVDTLHECLPSHVLVSWARSPSLHLKDIFDEERLLEIVQKAKSYEAEMMAAMRGSNNFPDDHTDMLPDMGACEEAEQLPWSADERQQAFFSETASAFIRPLVEEENITCDRLVQVLNNDLTLTKRHGSMTSDSALSGNTSELFDKYRPLLEVQSRLVNSSVLRLLFRDQSFRKHLRALQGYSLFGNGVFLTRLCSALFSSSAGSAEQRRGQVPMNTNLGLRLDARETQRWPPASSELRLTLAGILPETYHEDTATYSRLRELPGGLSFAVRDMSEEEIERVIDPTSIHALDFLKLQYTPPDSLKCLISDNVVRKYDEIFCFLLQLLRMLHLTSGLKTSLAINHSGPQKRILNEAHFLISTLSSHFMNIGIATPWQKFTARLDDLENTMEAEDRAGTCGSHVTIGLTGLAQLHEKTLDTIKARLFLRRKQEKLKAQLEVTFSIILRTASLCRSDDAVTHADAASFGALQQELTVSVREFITLLDEQVVKGQKVYDQASVEDDDTFSTLAQMLDFNGWYSRSDKAEPGFL